jgi:hypothetical protein
MRMSGRDGAKPQPRNNSTAVEFDFMQSTMRVSRDDLAKNPSRIFSAAA